MGKQKRKRRPQEGYSPHLKALILQVADNQIAGQDETGHPLTTTIAGEPNYVKTLLSGYPQSTVRKRLRK